LRKPSYFSEAKLHGFLIAASIAARLFGRRVTWERFARCLSDDLPAFPYKSGTAPCSKAVGCILAPLPGAKMEIADKNSEEGVLNSHE
jgi:hypothetical protein